MCLETPAATRACKKTCAPKHAHGREARSLVIDHWIKLQRRVQNKITPCESCVCLVGFQNATRYLDQDSHGVPKAIRPPVSPRASDFPCSNPREQRDASPRKAANPYLHFNAADTKTSKPIILSACVTFLLLATTSPSPPATLRLRAPVRTVAAPRACS